MFHICRGKLSETVAVLRARTFLVLRTLMGIKFNKVTVYINSEDSGIFAPGAILPLYT